MKKKKIMMVMMFLLLGVAQALAAVSQGPITNPSNGHRYYVLSPNTWTGAEAEAKSLGGHLVTINDAAENDWVWQTFAPLVGGPLWIGLSDSAQEGTFSWASDEAAAYRNWWCRSSTDCEPANQSGNENYVEMNDYVWNDNDNGKTFYSVAEVETPSLIVKLVSGLSAAEQAEVIARNGGSEISSVPALRLHVVKVPVGELSSVLSSYQSDPKVERAELNKVRKVEGTALPQDPSSLYQWALPKIGWDKIFGSTVPTGSATVAVLDTGIDASHSDLQGVVIKGISIIDGSDGMSDTNGHGTSLAGIIAALPDNGGISGVGYAGVRILPVTVLRADGTGQDSDIISGIMYAVEHGANVILMGFSNPGFSQNLQDAMDYAWSKNVVLVAPTGNYGLDGPTFPAGLRGVMGVSATDQSDLPAQFSNYGSSVFLAAPGTEMISTSLGNTYVPLNGTSASAAVVAGVAAFLGASDPTLSNGVIVGRLARTADPAAPREKTGNGRINMARALADTGTEEIQPAGADPVGIGGPYVGPYVTAGLAGNGEGTMAVIPASVVKGSTGNSFTFIFRSYVNDFDQNSQVTIQVPPGWTPPQSTDSANPGYITVSNNSCISAGLSSITGTGPWTIAVTMNCLKMQSFSVTYGGGSTQVTAPVAVNDYTFTTQTKQGTGGVLQNIVDSPVISTTLASTSLSLISSLHPSVITDSVTFTATVVPVSAFGTVPTGNVVFQDGGYTESPVLATVPLNSSGKAIFTTSGLTTGLHTITAHYEGDSTYYSSYGSFEQQVYQAKVSTVVTSSHNPSVYTDPVTITATVTPIAPVPVSGAVPTGNVVFYRYTYEGYNLVTLILATVPLDSSGKASFTTSSLPSSATIYAHYQGDSTYILPPPHERGSVEQQVYPAKVSTVVTSSHNPSVYTDPVTITATVTPIAPVPVSGAVPTGNVVFYRYYYEGYNLVTLTLATVPLDSSGKASFTTSSLPSSATIYAHYQGDSTYILPPPHERGSIEQQVDRAKILTVVTSSHNPSVYADSVTITATVTPVAPVPASGAVPTGNVHFYEYVFNAQLGYKVESELSTVPLDSSGRAIFSTSSLSPGVHNIFVLYQGDSTYVLPGVEGMVWFDQEVSVADTSIAVSSSKNPSASGEAVSFTAAVSITGSNSGTATGSVQFKIDGSNFGSPVALSGGSATSAAISTLAIGNHTITAEYSDPGNNQNPSSGALAGGQTVSSVNAPPVADAGINITIISQDQSATIVHGQASDLDGDALKYRWLEGSSVLTGWSPLGSLGEARLDLSAVPQLSLGIHYLVLEIDDGYTIAVDEMILSIDNSAPNAVASGDGIYQYGSPVPLGGQVSDFDGEVLSYEWVEGGTVLFTGNVATNSGGTPASIPVHTLANLGLGTHTLVLRVQDAVHMVESEIIVEVIDRTAPTLSPKADKNILWPPDHRMETITIAAAASDNSGGSNTLSAVVTSNEPQDGLGDGDMSPDSLQPTIDQALGVIRLPLRAERSGKGDGRLYTITITATDTSGNSSSADVAVLVPHDIKKK